LIIIYLIIKKSHIQKYATLRNALFRNALDSEATITCSYKDVNEEKENKKSIGKA